MITLGLMKNIFYPYDDDVEVGFDVSQSEDMFYHISIIEIVDGVIERDPAGHFTTDETGNVITVELPDKADLRNADHIKGIADMVGKQVDMDAIFEVRLGLR